MIKVYTAFTKEIDDPDLAVREICGQLNIKENAMKNTIGFIHFYHEFAETGVYQAIMEALPFDIAGCVSSYIGACGQYGDIALSVTMITSNDIRFKVKTVEGVSEKSREEITAELVKLCSEFCSEEKPKMIMPFMPPLPHFSGDELVRVANSFPRIVPLFGTLSFNMENVSGSSHFVIGNGKLSSNMFVFVAFYGTFTPKFRIASSFDLDDSLSKAAEITEADGSILKKVNGVSALEYLKNLGMITSNNTVTGSGIWAVPAVMTYCNGAKIIRAFLGIIEGTEYIYSTGAMEVGAKIQFAYLDGEKTVASAEKLFKEISAAKDNGIIAYSCAGRAWSLGSQHFAEAQKIAQCAEEYKQANKQLLNYNVAYSGGEICPITDSNGNMINALHNYTIISCSFDL